MEIESCHLSKQSSGGDPTSLLITLPLAVRHLISYHFSDTRKDSEKQTIQYGSKNRQQRKPLSLCNYIFFLIGGEGFLSPARMFDAKASLKTVATAATTKTNAPCKAINVWNQSLPLAAGISQIIRENVSPGISEHQLTVTCGYNAHWTESKH